MMDRLVDKINKIFILETNNTFDALAMAIVVIMLFASLVVAIVAIGYFLLIWAVTVPVVSGVILALILIPTICRGIYLIWKC